MTPILSVLIPVWNQEDLVIKALSSVPVRDDIEVLVCDNGSDDRTLERVEAWCAEHPKLRTGVYSNGVNMGCSFNHNRLLSLAEGVFFHILDSDDSVYTEAYSKLIDRLYDTDADVICFDLRVNNGDVWKVTEETANLYCAQTVRFIRRGFVDGLKFPEHINGASDWWFAQDILKRNPKTVYTGVLAYKYNHPRVGSIMNLLARGLIKD